MRPYLLALTGVLGFTVLGSPFALGTYGAVQASYANAAVDLMALLGATPDEADAVLGAPAHVYDFGQAALVDSLSAPSSPRETRVYELEDATLSAAFCDGHAHALALMPRAATLASEALLEQGGLRPSDLAVVSADSVRAEWRQPGPNAAIRISAWQRDDGWGVLTLVAETAGCLPEVDAVDSEAAGALGLD